MLLFLHALLVVSKLRVLGEHDVTNWSQGVILMIFWDVDKTNLKVVPDLGGFPQPTFHRSTISACFTGFSPHKKQLKLANFMGKSTFFHGMFSLNGIISYKVGFFQAHFTPLDFIIGK